MGMESFNAMPEMSAEDSERVEDKVLAEEAAYAGKQERDIAAELRQTSEGEKPITPARNGGLQGVAYGEHSFLGVDNSASEAEVRERAGYAAEVHDKMADVKEDIALKGYDDSGRINDSVLAERMAYAGKGKREEAVGYRQAGKENLADKVDSTADRFEDSERFKE